MKNLLIVDDSKVFKNILGKILKPYFNIVGTGSNGNEGFELFVKLRPDLVLMDITMPDCSGKESLERILKQDPTAIVVMVSGIGDEQSINDCRRLGAKGFIVKESITLSDKENSLIVKTISSLFEQQSREVA